MRLQSVNSSSKLTGRGSSSDALFFPVWKFEFLIGQIRHLDRVKDRDFTRQTLVEGSVHVPPVWTGISIA